MDERLSMWVMLFFFLFLFLVVITRKNINFGATCTQLWPETHMRLFVNKIFILTLFNARSLTHFSLEFLFCFVLFCFCLKFLLAKSSVQSFILSRLCFDVLWIICMGIPNVYREYIDPLLN